MPSCMRDRLDGENKLEYPEIQLVFALFCHVVTLLITDGPCTEGEGMMRKGNKQRLYAMCM